MAEEEISHPAQFWDGKPPTTITLRLVLEKSLTQAQLLEYDSLDEQEALERIRSLKSLHLQWLGLSEISGLEAFDAAEVLYLQANRLSRIENLEWLPRLQFLALQCNRIAVVENLTCLTSLEFLDLSRNAIVELEERELPKSINMLNFRGNVCAEAPDYKAKLLAYLPELAQLDGEEVELGSRTVAPDAANAESQCPATDAANAEAEEVILNKGSSSALGAYWMRKDLYAGLTADVKDFIDAYALESLGTEDSLGKKAQEALQRSRARREAKPLPTPAGLDGFIKTCT